MKGCETTLEIFNFVKHFSDCSRFYFCWKKWLF